MFDFQIQLFGRALLRNPDQAIVNERNAEVLKIMQDVKDLQDSAQNMKEIVQDQQSGLTQSENQARRGEQEVDDGTGQLESPSKQKCFERWRTTIIICVMIGILIVIGLAIGIPLGLAARK